MTQDGEPAALYAGYEVWKGWSQPFVFSDDDARYFAGETRDVRIRDADVLEIGFGSGSFLAWARAQGARIAGTEINDHLLDAARTFGVDLLPAAFETVADTQAGRFDTIVGLDVFEHFDLADVVRRLAAVQTLLKPGGHLVLRFPNAQSPFGLGPQNGDPTHRVALSRSVFEQLIQRTTFAVQRYAPSFRIGGGPLRTRLARALRGVARDTIARLLNAIYSQTMPWDPVVVLVLRKAP